jgi:hypothetical protein
MLQKYNLILAIFIGVGKLERAFGIRPYSTTYQLKGAFDFKSKLLFMQSGDKENEITKAIEK